jgi:putative membrane protein
MRLRSPSRVRILTILLVLVLAVQGWSLVRPYRWDTWLFETIWVPLGLVVIAVTWRRFPLTTLLCCVLALHAVVLSYGGHYTYALAPAGEWARDAFGLSRNPFDRLGHFMQGFAPAIAVRELLWRRSPLRGSRWLGFLTVCGCLALSAFWELGEWWAAYAVADGDPAFLGGQGDPWDTQWDMALALAGAVLAVAVFARWHDGQLKRLTVTAAG